MTTFDPYTGAAAPSEDSGHFASIALGLEPPRFCVQCGRRMIVQIVPDGWWARCSRHGTSYSWEHEQR